MWCGNCLSIAFHRRVGAFVFILFSPTFIVGQNVKYVNVFMGTSGDHGQVSPGATVPFGMVSVAPDTDPRSHAGYDYSVTKVSGISVNRLSGVGCSGSGGNLSIRPVSPTADLHIDKKKEKAFPGYYGVTFTNGIKVELTAKKSVAVEKYYFPDDIHPELWIDFSSSFEGLAVSDYKVISQNMIIGTIKARNVCGHGQYQLYFCMKTTVPFEVKEQNSDTISLSFDKLIKSVEVRVGLSALSAKLATRECDLSQSQNFAKIRAEAYKKWDSKLSSIHLKGGNEDLRTIFYTSLYRVYLSPSDVTSRDRTYKGSDGKVYSATDFRYYSSWSLWDTFRTKFPLLTLIEPDKMHDMALSLLHLYATGKKNWSTGNEAVPTVRTEHAVVLLLDIYRKGITNLDFNIGYEGMKREMERLSLHSPDQRMEASYDLWAMAQIADILGKRIDAQYYKKASYELFEKTWKKEFMHITPDFAVMHNNGLYQGTRWQYRWAAPQYLDKMIEWVGRDSLYAQLSYFFDNHLYNQGNEPDIHVPYMFNLLGRPQKTQRIVQDLITKPMLHRYGGNSEFKTPYFGKAFQNKPEGYAPEMDEDDGTMSAWYVFAAMGFYPLLVGDAYYELTSPLFKHIVLQLPNGHKLVIRTERQRNGIPIKSIYFNGELVKDYRISHNELIRGGELVFSY